MDFNTGLETKVAAGDANFELLQAFDAFKQANDERLGEIEKRMSADVVTSEKVERINRALDELTLKMKRPQLGVSEKNQPTEHRRAFDAYVRKGESAGLFDIEAKAMSVTSNADGGYLVPAETEMEIGRVMSTASTFRAIADVRQVSATTYLKPFAMTGAASGWVAENDVRPETASPTLTSLSFPTMELYAMPSATQSLLDDQVVNLDQWLAQEVQTVFAEQESQAFVAGNGTNVDVAGGAITGSSWFPTINGGAPGSNRGQDGYVSPFPFGASGGGGGGASNAGTGGAGGTGEIGCGGGGGGAGISGGAGGRGGHGQILIVCW